MRWRGRRSLRWSLIGPLLISAIAIVLVCHCLLLFSLQALSRNELNRRGRLVTEAVRHAAETTASDAELQRFVFAIGNVPAIENLVVVDPAANTVIASSHPERLGQSLTTVASEMPSVLSAPGTSTYGEAVFEMSEGITLSGHPDIPRRALVVLQLRNIYVEQALQRTLLATAALLTIGLLLLMLASLWLLQRNVLNPMARLLRTMRLRTSGDVNATARPEAIGEWSEIGESFNEMLKTLNDHSLTSERAAERFHTIFEHSTSAIILMDERGVFDCNQAALHELRCSRKSQVLGLSMLDFAPACQPDGTPSPIKCGELMTVSQRRGQCRSECQLRRRDGAVFFADLALTPIRVDEREGFLLTFHDISEFKQAQDDLRRSKEVIEKALRELSSHKYALDQHAIVAVTDANGIITYANERFCQISGYRNEELLGQTHARLKSGQHPPEFYREMWSTIASGRVWRGEICNRNKQGRLYWVESTIVPFRDAAGRIEHYVSIRSDITARKEAEVALRRAKEIAEEADRAKSIFLATMSHEIRTPMNGVIGMAQLLARTHLNEQQREFLHTIEVSGSTLISLINDILDFSKIEAGKLELEHVAFELRHAMEDTVDLVAPLAAQKGLELALIIAPGTPSHVLADVTRLRQILFNLLSNAIKFTPTGEVVLRAWATPVAGLDGRRQQLHFAVRDTGIGIPKDRQDRLFRAFTQVDAGTSRQFGGTGLGLAICERLVAMMGGQIGVESDAGIGSTFSFHIAAELPTEETSPALSVSPELRQVQAIIVEPNTAQRESLHGTITSQGITATAYAAWPSAESVPPGAFWLVNEEALRAATASGATRQARRQGARMILLRRTPDEAVDLPDHDAVLHKPVKAQSLVSCLLRLRGLKGLTQPPFAHTSPTPQAEPEGTGSLLAPPHRWRVLVADDNQVNQKVLALMLKRQGCDASVVANGQEALALLATAAFDLLMFDVQMPVLDGYQASMAVRRLPDATKASLPIVAVTAGAMRGDREKALAAGMNDYLSKPITEAALTAVLRRTLPAAAPESAQ